MTGSVGAAFVWGLLPPLALVLGLWWLDRYEKEPVQFLGLAFLFGAIATALIAVGLEHLFGVSSSLVGQASVPRSELGVGTPVLEEVARCLTIAALLFLVRHELDDLLDGLIYGAVVGLGLDAAANFVSISQTPTVGNTDPALFGTMIGGLNQAFYGALIGVAFAYARRAPSFAHAAAASAAGVLLAIGFHLLHDYLPWWVASAPGSVDGAWWRRIVGDLPNALGILAMAAIAAWTLGREAVLVSTQLAPEVDDQVLSADDYRTVTNPTLRFLVLATTLLRSGLRPWLIRRRLYADAVELAFRKHHLESRRRDLTGAREESEYRDRIRRARAELGGIS
jgi:protease PrsW